MYSFFSNTHIGDYRSLTKPDWAEFPGHWPDGLQEARIWLTSSGIVHPPVAPPPSALWSSACAQSELSDTEDERDLDEGVILRGHWLRGPMSRRKVGFEGENEKGMVSKVQHCRFPIFRSVRSGIKAPLNTWRGKRWTEPQQSQPFSLTKVTTEDYVRICRGKWDHLGVRNWNRRSYDESLIADGL